LKITTEDLGERQIMLTIEVEEERVDRALRGVARKLGKEYNIPGFRRGRAPYSVVLQRFGREALLQEALDDLAQEVYVESLESEDLEPYDIGSLEDVQLDPLVLKLRVPLRPVVDLGDYRQLRVEPPAVKVDPDEIDAELERLRQDQAMLEPAGERPAEIGDWVSLDIVAKVGDESLLNQEAHELVLDAEDVEPEAGFSQQIVGMAAGDEKEFELTLGDQWGDERTGQKGRFQVSLREVRARIVPDLDDDLARTVGDFDTFAELRDDVERQFEEVAQRDVDAQYAEEAIEALLNGATIEFPPDLLKDQIDDLAKDVERRLEPQGVSLEDYYKLSGQTEEAFRDSLKPRAEAILKRGLALAELAQLEQLDVEGDEVEKRISRLSSSWGERAGEVREVLSAPESLRSIASNLLADKAVQRLMAIARGEAPELESETDAEPGSSGENKEGPNDLADAAEDADGGANTVDADVDPALEVD
jgi:trigger factor